MKRNLLFRIMSLLLLGGCAGIDMEEGRNVDQLKEVSVNLTFAVGGEALPVTRSVAFTATGVAASATDTLPVPTKASAVDANSVNTLWVGQYDASGNLLIARYLTGVSGNQARLQLKESPDCSLRFVANTEDLGAVATLAAFNTKKTNYTATAITCPMFGSLDKQHVSVSYKPAVPMIRMQGHIRLVYAVGSKLTFIVKGVSLRNVPTQMQCTEPAGQAAGVTYQDLAGTVSQSGATIDWYMPENKAGTITSGGNGFAATDRQKCGGTGVPNATYIEITGDATANGTTYTNVVFRLYPGSGMNDYNVKRNTPYITNVTLSGIDLSDPRVSVTVPDIVQPATLEAALNSTSSIQVPFRPGTTWTFTLPAWLSATTSLATVGAGGKVDFTGPTPLKFTAVTANPDATVRSQKFTLAGKEITVTQNGSEFSVAPLAVSDLPNTGGTFTSTITATGGLPWTIEGGGTGFTPSKASGAGTLAIIYTVANNTGNAARTATYTIAVTGANPARSATVMLRQGIAQGKILYVEEADRSGYVNWGYSKDYAKKIEVNTSTSNSIQWPTAVSYCSGLGGGWRLPTMVELWTMYKYRSSLGITSPGGKFWSITVYTDRQPETSRMGVNFSNGAQDWYNYSGGGSQWQNARCVRTI